MHIKGSLRARISLLTEKSSDFFTPFPPCHISHFCPYVRKLNPFFKKWNVIISLPAPLYLPKGCMSLVSPGSSSLLSRAECFLECRNVFLTCPDTFFFPPRVLQTDAEMNLLQGRISKYPLCLCMFLVLDYAKCVSGFPQFLMLAGNTTFSQLA